MKSPRKLIRSGIAQILAIDNLDKVTDPEELNRLYALKIREETAEIQRAGHQDINEFADLVHAAFAWAEANGFTVQQVQRAMSDKVIAKGTLSNVVLTKLNPNDPSNNVYCLERYLDMEY